MGPYQISLDSFASKDTGSKSCQSSAQRVASDNDLVAGICSTCFVYCVQNASLGLEPGAPETCCSIAVTANGGWCVGEVEVGDPVPDGARAAEGNYDELVRCVCGDEAGCICCKGAELMLASKERDVKR